MHKAVCACVCSRIPKREYKQRTAGPELMIGLSVICLLQCRLNNKIYPLIDVIVVPFRIVLNLIVRAVEIDPRTVSSTSRTVQSTSKDLSRITHRFTSLPNPLKTTSLMPCVKVLIIRSPPKQRFHSSLCGEQPCLRVAVSKRIDLPRTCVKCEVKVSQSK